MGYYEPSERFTAPAPEYDVYFQSDVTLRSWAILTWVRAEPYCDSSLSCIAKMYFMEAIRVSERQQFTSIGSRGCDGSLHQPEFLRSLQQFGLITSKPVPGRSIGRIRDGPTSFIRQYFTLQGFRFDQLRDWRYFRFFLEYRYDALFDGEAASLLTYSQMLMIIGVTAGCFACCCVAVVSHRAKESPSGDLSRLLPGKTLSGGASPNLRRFWRRESGSSAS